jgi:hypothetical protein
MFEKELPMKISWHKREEIYKISGDKIKEDEMGGEYTGYERD